MRAASTFVKSHFNPSRFIKEIFADTAYAREHIADEGDFVNTIFAAAVNMPNLDHLHVSLMDLFTNEEGFILWQAANLQLIFFKNERTNDILVKILQCEKPATIPVKTDAAPYYHWKDVRAYYEKKIAGYIPPGDNSKKK
jgi:hypothetical protein